MLEQVLAFLLKTFLGSFVENGESMEENIQVGVWSGLIVLENLQLKSSLFSLIDIPIALSYGYIGRLEIRIPWSNLGVEPVMVIVEKVYVVVEPKYQWNPGAADRREQTLKQAKLAAAELFASKRFTASSSSQSYRDIVKNWLVSSLINKIVDNIQVNIREVHIRYEDQLSCPSDFCVGITLESLHILSRDSSIVPDVNSPTRRGSEVPELQLRGYDTFHKTIQINHFSVYWNPLVQSGFNVCSCNFRGRPSSEILSFMWRTIPTRAHQNTDRPKHHYILLPVDINNYLDVSFNTSTGMAKVRNLFMFVFINL